MQYNGNSSFVVQDTKDFDLTSNKTLSYWIKNSIIRNTIMVCILEFSLANLCFDKLIS